MQVVREREEKISVILHPEDLEKMGSRSLLGGIYGDRRGLLNTYLEEVELVFPQSSPDEISKNGPREFIASEFLLPCFLSDVLELQTRGFRVTVSTPERP